MDNNNEDFWEKITSCGNIYEKCESLGKTGELYKLSQDELVALYGEIENGLIDQNYLIQKYSDKLEKCFGSVNGKILLNLESKLMGVAFQSLIRYGSKKILKEYMTSPWTEKLKDREYFNKLSNLIGMPDHLKDKFYSLFFEKSSSV